jgi:gamma-glutamyltranspeptidase/glutathione hydrolase
MTRLHARLVAVAVLLALLASTSTALARQGSRFRPDVNTTGAVVATESPIASGVARTVLAHGGNAMDAAVAGVFALGVARPQSCGIGGGGFLVYRTAGGQTATLDFREAAPRAFTPGILAGPGPHKDFTGHRTIGVPGTVAGMAAALARYGTIPLAQAIAPAERLARTGVRVQPSLSSDMASESDRLVKFPVAAKQYLVNGTTPYAPFSTLKQPGLAASLRAIERGGSDAFYKGDIAHKIVADMKTAPQQLAGDAGLMTLADLAAYDAVWRPALQGSFRGSRLIAVPPPTSGGTTMLEILNLLEPLDLGATDFSADGLHQIAEAQKIAWADRGAYVADPDVVKVPTSTLISKGYAASRRGEIDLGQAKTYGPGLGPPPAVSRTADGDTRPEASTTSLAVIDDAGNAVALTCTIEQSFGSAVVAPGTGFLLNNEMTDFGDPGTANEPGPAKRPRSSIDPAIVVKGGRPILAIGGAGGARIIMGVTMSVLRAAAFGSDPANAVDGERLDDTGTASADGKDPPLTMTLEDTRLTPDILASLAARGHILKRVGEYDTRPRVQAAGEAGSHRLATTDPRSVGDFAAMAAPRAAGALAAWPAGRSDTTSPTVRLRLLSAVCGRRSIKARLGIDAADRGGAGVGYTTILLQAPGSPLQRTLLRNVTKTSFPFTGSKSAHVLIARSTDRAGNVSLRYSFTLRCMHKTLPLASPTAGN